jgi:ATP-binding cassette subfamily B protein
VPIAAECHVQDIERPLPTVGDGDLVDLGLIIGFGEPICQVPEQKVTLSRETLGIVGKTGAGKTTLLKLLIRESEGFDGDILFGERRIDEYKLERLREAIGYVPQEHFLFSATVAENISFAKPDASIDVLRQSHPSHIRLGRQR